MANSISKSRSKSAIDKCLDIDDLIVVLLEDCVQYTKTFPLSTNCIAGLCEEAKSIFLRQPMLLEIDAPLKICGDVHGQYTCLLNLFKIGGFPSKTNKYLFLGDYVDRGKQSLETITLLLAYKIKYPDHFFMLRGNHECSNTNLVYGFFDECKRRCDSAKVWKIYVDVFNCLPMAAIISKRIFCCHGGLSPKLNKMKNIANIKRPSDVPKMGLMCDLMWADPDKTRQGFNFNRERGISVTFGVDVISKFLKKHDFDLIVRGHEVVQDGYQFFGSQKLVTIFSAPNYCGMFENRGGILNVDKNLDCSFSTFEGSSNVPSQLLLDLPYEHDDENKTTYVQM